MPMRPPSRVLRNWMNPSPRLPRTFSFGNDGVLKMQRAGVAGPPPHLFLFLARAHARDLGQLLRVADAGRAAGRDVDGVLGDDQAGDAAVALSRIGAGGDREDLSDAGVGDEALGAVEDEMVALVHGGRGGAAGVAAGAGLGEPEAAHDPPRREQRHILVPLLLGTELHQGRRAKVGMRADGEAVRRIDLGHLVDGDVVGDLVHPRPARAPPARERPAGPAHPSSGCSPGKLAGRSSSRATGATLSRANSRTMSRTWWCCSEK